MDKKLIVTDDGSHSLYVPELNENYHSTHGAWNEAMHVFIKMGFHKLLASDNSILEIGFGTGLNTMLTAFEALKSDIKVQYTSLEKYPLDKTLLEQLNYYAHIPEYKAQYKQIFDSIHNAEWGSFQAIHDSFSLRKLEESVLDWKLDVQFDLIYFDAFAPEKQPEMWDEAVLERLYQSLKSGGFLTTYCAKGIIKRRLKGIGYKVENVPGPPGKREMTLAYK